MTSDTPHPNEPELGTGEAPPERRQSLARIVPGTLIQGKYRVDRVIGRGGMGVVLSAMHVDLNQRVAIKFLEVVREEQGGDFRARFVLEARVCAKLKNPHIARVQDVSVWQGIYPFMVMDYLEGEDLRHVLSTRGKLPIDQAVDYAVQICEGLAEAHAQGIIHRDLKPPNIFITKQHDGSDLVKVLDFGISKWTSGEGVEELTKDGMMLGSPKYMSPEQLNGSGIDSRSDVWSIGAILYTMLTGAPPFNFAQVSKTYLAIASGSPPPAPSTMEPSISPELDAVILGCMTLDRRARIQNVAELAGMLLEAVGSPFATQVRRQIAVVLDPSLRPSSPTGLMMATGSHTAFSVGRTSVMGVSRSMPAPPLPSPPPDPLATSPTGATRKRRPWIVLTTLGSAAAVLAVAALIRGPEATGSPEQRSRDYAMKHLVHESPSALIAPRVDPTPQRAPAPPMRARGWAYEPPARGSRALSSLSSGPPFTAPPEPHVPASTPSRASARAAATASALEDRQ